MSRIALIHGFAVHLTAPIIRRGFGPTASFRAFASLVETGEARVFSWGVQRRAKPWQLLNLFFLHDLYLAERKLTMSPALHTELSAFFVRERPEVIVCHSMGSVLLAEYLKQNALPNSVRVIVFVQSDLPATTAVSAPVPIYNLYCPWDPTLMLSSFNALQWKAGVAPLTSKDVTNILFPLTKPLNLHTSSIRDPKLVAFVRSL
jgi:hypothetical protein